MTDTPYAKYSETSWLAAKAKDEKGNCKRHCEKLLALLQERGAMGVTLFEAATYLTHQLGVNVYSSTASARLNDLMRDDKCERHFGCRALVTKSTDKAIRRRNPESGMLATPYILKSFATPVMPVPTHSLTASGEDGGGGGSKCHAHTPAVSINNKVKNLARELGWRGQGPQLDFGFGVQIPPPRF